MRREKSSSGPALDEMAAKLTDWQRVAGELADSLAQALRQWNAYHDGTFEQAVDEYSLSEADNLEARMFQTATKRVAAFRALSEPTPP
jgi:hypothetical protein